MPPLTEYRAKLHTRMTLFEYLKNLPEERQCAYTLNITLLNGTSINEAVVEYCHDGVVTEVQGVEENCRLRNRRFIPLTSIAFFDLEWLP